MINFENATCMDKISQMSKDALTICKEVIDSDNLSLYDLPLHYLIDALEIKMDSVGYYHHDLDTTYYDLCDIACVLAVYYSKYDIPQCVVALVLWERTYYETDNE